MGGLGKYLISKLEIAMGKAGALEVDKITGKAGNFVFMNAHSVGLSSKLPTSRASLSACACTSRPSLASPAPSPTRHMLARRPRCSCLLPSGLETKRHQFR